MNDKIKRAEPFPEADDHDELNRQGDYVSGEIGPDGKDVIVGKNIDSEQRNQTQTVNFSNRDNAILWQQMLRQNENAGHSREQIMDKIAELVVSLDDLPARVGKLEVKVIPDASLERLIRNLTWLVLLMIAAGIIAGIMFYFRLWFQ